MEKTHIQNPNISYMAKQTIIIQNITDYPIKLITLPVIIGK